MEVQVVVVLEGAHRVSAQHGVPHLMPSLAMIHRVCVDAVFLIGAVHLEEQPARQRGRPAADDHARRIGVNVVERLRFRDATELDANPVRLVLEAHPEERHLVARGDLIRQAQGLLAASFLAERPQVVCSDAIRRRWLVEIEEPVEDESVLPRFDDRAVEPELVFEDRPAGGGVDAPFSVNRRELEALVFQLLTLVVRLKVGVRGGAKQVEGKIVAARLGNDVSSASRSGGIRHSVRRCRRRPR